ncbi:metal ABC transporter solute-binding protein, Zn/Mn family [Streptococcus caprae]|uniref:Metal ABC transporter solute-binding protein, Zn/Mn family n=1 Tax=Streptococcus caprae TaxID=1640501 RepID=A0ABV8CV93_9STRE
MKKIIYWISCFVAIGCLTACHKTSQKTSDKEGLKIVTSFYPIYAMTKEVSGDLNDVRMIQSSQGIHGFEPSVSDVHAIYDADVFIYHSHVLESWAGRLDPTESKSDVTFIEASKGLELQRVEGLEDIEVGEGIDEATLYDPHTWLDPVLVADEVEHIAQELSQLDPEHADSYQKNADKMKAEALELVDQFSPLFASASRKTFVTQHTAFAYLAKRFGIQQLGILGVSEEEPSPRQLSEIKDFIEEYNVKTIFVERGSSDKMAQALKTSTGVKTKILEPLEADPQNHKSYLENLKHNLTVLARDLK